MPEADELADVIINNSDLRIDTFLAYLVRVVSILIKRILRYV